MSRHHDSGKSLNEYQTGIPATQSKSNRTIALTEKGWQYVEYRRRLAAYPHLDPRPWPLGDWLEIGDGTVLALRPEVRL